MRWIMFVAIIVALSLGREQAVSMENPVEKPVPPAAAEPAEWTPAAETEPPELAASQAPTLSTVNGISLYDGKADVIRKLGAPDAVAHEEWLPELEIFHYPGMQVAFADPYIQYVDIDLSRALVIDGTAIEASAEALIEAFGEPDFVAEDGIVFRRGAALLKLFLDEASRKPLYVSYYHIATV